MKKKQVVCLIAFILLALIIPSNVSAKELKTEKVTCKYQYNNRELTYKVYTNNVVVPFEDGENNWYHQYEFADNYYEQAKINSINYVCPTITIEESNSFTTVFNNPKKEADCNGRCTTLVAKEALSKENITVKKAVDTTAISSVGIYEDTKYFIPYFRILEDGAKEWSVNGKKFVTIKESIQLKTSNEDITKIKLDETLVNVVFKNNKLNDTTIYRNVKKISANQYEYLLATKKVAEYKLTDGQETAAASYNGSLGDTTEEEMEEWLEGYEGQQDCSGDNSILGSYDDPKSVAWLVKKVLDYTQLIGPFIVVIMSGIDFAKVIVMGDDEGLKKAQSKLIIRVLLAASLFVLPEIVEALLDIFGITSSGTCGLSEL